MATVDPDVGNLFDRLDPPFGRQSRAKHFHGPFCRPIAPGKNGASSRQQPQPQPHEHNADGQTDAGKSQSQSEREKGYAIYKNRE